MAAVIPRKLLSNKQVKTIGKRFVPASYINNSFVVLVKGTRGEGKTLWCAINMYMYWKQGLKVYHNGALNFGEELDIEVLLNYAEDDQLENCFIFIDEAQVLFDSWSSGSTALKKLIHYITMIRHKRINLYMTTQFLGDLSGRIVQQIDYVITPKSYLKFYTTGPKSGMIQSHKLVADYVSTQNTPQGMRRSHLKTINNAQAYYGIYDTGNMVDHQAVMDDYTSGKIRENIEMNRELQIGYWLRDRIIPGLGGQKVTAAQITNQWASDTKDVIESKHMMKILKNTYGLVVKRSGNAAGIILPKKPENLKLLLLDN